MAFIPQVADTLLFYEMQIKDYDVTKPITPDQSLAQKIAMDSTETQLFYLQANGRKLMPPYKHVNISTMTEEEWLIGQNRGFDQVHVNQYSSLNYNGCSFTQDFAWGDLYRFKNGEAGYTDDSGIAYQLTEMVQSFTHARDPPVGNLGGYIVNAAGSMTSFGKGLHLGLIANPGTKFW